LLEECCFVGGSKKILVCDDDPLLVDLVEYRLAARGFEVVVAHDGGEALARLAEGRPDAILLDAMMPVIDGYELLRRIRADETMAGVPVIMLTARRQESDIVTALELGASDYLVKPFIPEELVARLTRLLGAPAR
jgi:DNA-binding response OmpR family regulator